MCVFVFSALNSGDLCHELCADSVRVTLSDNNDKIARLWLLCKTEFNTCFVEV